MSVGETNAILRRVEALLERQVALQHAQAYATMNVYDALIVLLAAQDNPMQGGAGTKPHLDLLEMHRRGESYFPPPAPPAESDEQEQ